MTVWTPVTSQNEVWKSDDLGLRTFSPRTFSRRPVFDTGSAAGVWDGKAITSETWVPA